MLPNAQACIACGEPTVHTCETAPCCPSWACGSRALEILAADWEFVNAVTNDREACSRRPGSSPAVATVVPNS